MMICDIKCTFRIKQPKNIRILIDKNTTEQDFVRRAFDELTLEEVRQLDRLICADVDGLQKYMVYLGNGGGCYYFSVDVNHDEDTWKWHSFKSEYLDKRKKWYKVRKLGVFKRCIMVCV
jgi:hypothetical protein